MVDVIGDDTAVGFYGMGNPIFRAWDAIVVPECNSNRQWLPSFIVFAESPLWRCLIRNAYPIPVEQYFIPRIEQFIQNNTCRSTVVLQAWQAWLHNIDTEESEV